MAVKTSKKKTTLTAVTIGRGNPGIAKLSKKAAIDVVLAASRVDSTGSSPKLHDEIPTGQITLCQPISIGSKKISVNILDLWADTLQREAKILEDRKNLLKVILPLAEKMRIGRSRKDKKYYKSIYVNGILNTANFKTKLPQGIRPSELLTKEQILAILKAAFGPEWTKFFEVKQKLVLAPGLSAEKLKAIAAALKEHNLDFGELVVEEVEYQPTEYLHQQETLDPQMAEKTEELRTGEKKILKPMIHYIQKKD
jgi:hypothetical protein